MSNKNINKFQELILPHLDAAYNYALWLVRNRHDAEDLTQEAFSRALGAFATFTHTNPKAWLMTIVRNTFFNHQQKNKRRGEVVYLDHFNGHTNENHVIQDHNTPERQAIQQDNKVLLHQAIDDLAPEFREVIVLREIEGFSYDEIALILDCAIGTVMSRLSRARDKLRTKLSHSISAREQTP